MVKLIPDLVWDKFQRHIVPARGENRLMFYWTVSESGLCLSWLLKDWKFATLSCGITVLMNGDTNQATASTIPGEKIKKNLSERQSLCVFK
jgi:hypothetical protein